MHVETDRCDRFDCWWPHGIIKGCMELRGTRSSEERVKKDKYERFDRFALPARLSFFTIMSTMSSLPLTTTTPCDYIGYPRGKNTDAM